MTADLEMIDGQAQVMLRDIAWHRMGMVVDDNFGWLDAVAQNLAITWAVNKVALRDLVIGHETRDEYCAVRSDGKILKSGHGDQWTPFQAEGGYEFGQALRNEGGLQADLRSLGTLAEGCRWFMTFDCGTFKIGDYDVKDYLSVNGSYDGSWTLQAITSPTVEVCSNTVAFAQATGVTHYKFKHTSGIFDRVEEAVRAANRHAENRAAIVQLGELLLAKPVSGTTYGQVMDDLFPMGDEVSVKTSNESERARDAVSALTAQGTLVDSTPNAWNLVQAVNTFENWGVPIRKTKGQSEADTRALRQIEQVVSGRQPLTNRATQILVSA